MKSQIQQMVEAGQKCASEYPHRRVGGQVYDDLPLTCLDKDGKPTTTKARQLIAAWNIGFVGGSIPKAARLQVSDHGAGRKSVQVFIGETRVADYNI